MIASGSGRVPPSYCGRSPVAAWLLVVLTAAATSCGFCLWSWTGKVYAGTLTDSAARRAATDTDLPLEERRTALSEVFVRTKQNLYVLRASIEEGGALADDAKVWARKLLPVVEELAKEGPR